MLKTLPRISCALWHCSFGTAHAADTTPAVVQDWVGLAVYIFGIAIVTWVFIYTLRCFLRPGEHDTQHVKRRILHDGW